MHVRERVRGDRQIAASEAKRHSDIAAIKGVVRNRSLHAAQVQMVQALTVAIVVWRRNRDALEGVAGDARDVARASASVVSFPEEHGCIVDVVASGLEEVVRQRQRAIGLQVQIPVSRSWDGRQDESAIADRQVQWPRHASGRVSIEQDLRTLEGHAVDDDCIRCRHSERGANALGGTGVEGRISCRTGINENCFRSTCGFSSC